MNSNLKKDVLNDLEDVIDNFIDDIKNKKDANLTKCTSTAAREMPVLSIGAVKTSDPTSNDLGSGDGLPAETSFFEENNEIVEKAPLSIKVKSSDASKLLVDGCTSSAEKLEKILAQSSEKGSAVHVAS